MDHKTAAILTQSKSTGIAALLTLLFGGWGLFYVSIVSGLIATLIEIILGIVTFITFGFGLVLLVPFHIICLIWAMSAVNKYNRNLVNSVA